MSLTLVLLVYFSGTPVFAVDGSTDKDPPTQVEIDAKLKEQINVFKADEKESSMRQAKFDVKNLADSVLPDIATWVASFLAGLAVVFLIVAGIQYLTAGGEEEKITKATKTAFYVLAGVLLVMFAYAIVYLFISLLTPGT